MTNASHSRPSLTPRRVMADLHVRELHLHQHLTAVDRAIYVTLVPPTGGRLDVVRYTKNRKWWLEGVYGDERVRLPLTLEEAAQIAACSAVERWSVYYPGVPGGEKLDKLTAEMIRREQGSDEV